jgi:hypothetical protein
MTNLLDFQSPHEKEARVLVVWSEIPEAVYFVPLRIPYVNIAAVQRWHNHFVNGGDTPPDLQREIHDAFYNEKGEFRWGKYDLPLRDRTFDLIIHTGFVI